MSDDIKTHLANDLEQSAAMLDSREFDAVQLDNCASMMRYAATVIRQAIAEADKQQALDAMAENARELGLDYMEGSAERYEKELEPPAQQELVAIEYWLQDTMESGRWVTTDNMARATAEKMLSGEYGDVYPQGRIVESSPPAQPAREPLTDEQIAIIASTPCAVVGSYVHTFARAIEAAHGITKGGAA